MTEENYCLDFYQIERHGFMNKDLEYLYKTGDILKRRTLQFVIDEEPVAYVTEFQMTSALGPFKWYLTWKDVNQNDKMKLEQASIMIHDARARVYFPAFLDTRIPPENREDLEELMQKYHLDHYDKFDFIIATKARSPIKAGTVHEIENIDCPFDEIHAINEIVAEYHRTLN